jgi:hypothetical protein
MLNKKKKEYFTDYLCNSSFLIQDMTWVRICSNQNNETYTIREEVLSRRDEIKRVLTFRDPNSRVKVSILWISLLAPP